MVKDATKPEACNGAFLLIFPGSIMLMPSICSGRGLSQGTSNYMAPLGVWRGAGSEGCPMQDRWFQLPLTHALWGTAEPCSQHIVPQGKCI